jgi:hypothetical protein
VGVTVALHYLGEQSPVTPFKGPECYPLVGVSGTIPSEPYCATGGGFNTGPRWRARSIWGHEMRLSTAIFIGL